MILSTAQPGPEEDVSSTRSQTRPTLIAALLAAGGLALALPASAETPTSITCYPASSDVDGDGYANTGAIGELVDTFVGEDLVCPAPFLTEKTDCDDTRADVHRYAPELGFNGRSDDCDALVDELELVYSPNGRQNTDVSFQIRARYRSWELLMGGSSIYYDIEVADLAASEWSWRTPKHAVGPLAADGTFDAAVTGLLPTRVYRARFRFYRRVVTETRKLTGALAGRISVNVTYTELGQPSEWYHTTTTGPDQTSQARTRILLEGFYQLDESDRGRVGYWGSADRDGTRYGASRNEHWCTEFYTWLAKPVLWEIGWMTNVRGLIDWFEMFDEFHPGPAAATTVARRADYVALDLSAPAGKGDHSAMFLGYDTTLPGGPRIWVLEGNAGNHVAVSKYSINDDIVGIGHVAYEELW